MPVGEETRAALDARLAALEAEASARATEALTLRSVLDTVPAVVMRISLGGTIEFINRVLPEYARSPPVGQSIYAFAPPDQHAVMQRALEDVIRTRSLVTFESIAEAPDGTRDWYASSVGPVLDGDALVGLTMVSTNVTRVKRIEEALRQSRAELDLALDAGNFGVWRWDAARDVVRWDDKLCAMFGLTRAEAPRTYGSFLALVSDDQRAAMREHVESAMATGHYPDFELRADLPGGTRWFVIKGGTQRDAGGRVAGLLGGVVDETERRLMAEQLRQAQKLEAIGQLSAGIAHNFNNILAVVVPVLELARKSPSSLDGELVADALSSALSAADLVRQLMLFSRTRPGAALRHESLAAVLERAVALCRRTFDRRIALAIEGLEVARGADVDGSDMEQAVLNLLLNARDAVEGSENPRIDVHVRRLPALERPGAPDGDGGEVVQVRIHDNGRGMDEATRQRVFEPFFTTKPVGRGTGLGLSTAWATAQRHGGSLECESAVNEGATFCLTIPVHGGAARSRASAEPTERGRGKRVLVIDDEPAVRRATAAALTAYGYVVRTAESGDEGVALAAAEPVDVVLLDYSMPGLSARATLEGLRAQRPGLPIVCSSGMAVTLEGATLHLPKPATAEMLHTAIATALAREA